MELKIAAPDGTALMADADRAMELVGAIVIDCPEMKSEAGNELRTLSAKATALEKQRKDLKEPALEMGRRVDALFKPAQDRIATAINVLKGAILTYDRAEEQKRAAAQRAADEAARIERDRLQKEADERERAARVQREQEQAAAREREAEQRRQAETLRTQAAESEDPIERQRLADEASERERRASEDAERERQEAEEREQREREEAAAQRSLSRVISAPAIQSEAPKVSGISTRQNWKIEIVDIKALCRAVADGTVPESYITANEKTLGQMARALKAEFKVPGVRAFFEDVLSARAA